MHRVAPIVGLASHLGRGVQRIATDAIVSRARSLPRAIVELDVAFLSQLMGRSVASMSVIGGDAGTSSRARLALTGEGVPNSVFVKMPAETVATRLIGELGRLAATETRFYSRLSPKLTGVPRCYGSVFDSLTGRFVLVLEDLAAEECQFPDTLHPLNKDQTSLIVELLARPRCSPREWAACRPRASPWKACAGAWPRSRTSTRSPSSRSHCDRRNYHH